MFNYQKSKEETAQQIKTENTIAKKEKKDKRTNNDLHNTTQKTED